MAAQIGLIRCPEQIRVQIIGVDPFGRRELLRIDKQRIPAPRQTICHEGRYQ